MAERLLLFLTERHNRLAIYCAEDIVPVLHVYVRPLRPVGVDDGAALDERAVLAALEVQRDLLHVGSVGAGHRGLKTIIGI